MDDTNKRNTTDGLPLTNKQEDSDTEYINHANINMLPGDAYKYKDQIEEEEENPHKAWSRKHFPQDPEQPSGTKGRGVSDNQKGPEPHPISVAPIYNDPSYDVRNFGFFDWLDSKYGVIGALGMILLLGYESKILDSIMLYSVNIVKNSLYKYLIK